MQPKKESTWRRHAQVCADYNSGLDEHALAAK
jgi:hypothetical protein